MTATDPTAPDAVRLSEVMRLALLEGQSIRAIARRLHLARRTVRKLLGRGRKQPRASAPTPRPSLLAPYAAAVQRLLTDTPELKAPTILERLRPLGYTGGISILRDRVRALRPTPPREAFLTLDFAPGAAYQVDWADFGFALPGCPRRVSGFIMAAAYSRYMYLEFTLSQAMGTFLRCMERGLRFYGGVAVADIFDYVARYVIEVLCPLPLRGLRAANSAPIWRSSLKWTHNDHRRSSQARSVSSFRQTGFAGSAAEAVAGGSHACSAASFARMLISA